MGTQEPPEVMAANDVRERTKGPYAHISSEITRLEGRRMCGSSSSFSSFTREVPTD